MYTGPNIITSGSVLYLDAANAKSYVTGSTVWVDRSGFRNNGTITGSNTFPAYSANSLGTLVFNGTSTIVNCGNSASLQIISGSISIWFRGTQINPGGSGGYNGLIVKQNAFGLFMTGSNLVTYDWGGGGGVRNTNINVGNNQWYNACLTFSDSTGTPSNNAIVYLNGVAVLTTTIKNLNQTIPLQIGNGGSPPTQYFNGSVSNAQVYNRVLSASEVLQNYNATKARFGL